MHGKVYPLARWVGIKSKEAKARLGDTQALPSLDEAKEQLADRLTTAVERLQREQQEKLAAQKAGQEQERLAEKAKAEAQRQLQIQWQKQRKQAEALRQKARFNKGVRGVVDRVTGKHTKTKQANALEAFRNAKRDEQQRDALIAKQQDSQERLKTLQDKAREKPRAIERSLKTDQERLDAFRNREGRTPRGMDGPER